MSNAIDVLLVEDSPRDARIIQEVRLEASGNAFDLEVVEKLAEVKADMNGNILSRAIHFAIDRAHTEQQIKTLNAELEQKVKDRTQQLEAANKELEMFSYSVSHDLRAPIRQIEGFANILASDHAHKLTADGSECLMRILEAVHRMQAMTTDLLNLAKISRQALVVEKTNLNALVADAVYELKPDIERRNIEWKIGPLPTVECDSGLMKQVFANLIGNAVKYTRKCESAVIEIGHTTFNGEPVIFVADNGAGFDMKRAGKLFSPFQRMHRSNDFEGTGVGLSTVQRIIQRQGGHIWADASPGKGAKFFFTLCTHVPPVPPDSALATAGIA
jgi:light-regulated signal transduction histidine kinase (bacteriophytochrome)